MYVDLVVDGFFAVDIILMFFVAYLDKSTYLLVDDHTKIAIRCAYPSPFIFQTNDFICTGFVIQEDLTVRTSGGGDQSLVFPTYFQSMGEPFFLILGMSNLANVLAGQSLERNVEFVI